MTTDRELLELAAKAAIAAGVPIIQTNAGMKILQATADGVFDIYGTWSPLTDDGDSRRLEVELGMTLDITRTGAVAYVYVQHQDDEPIRIGVVETFIEHDGDKSAAARRAVFDAAAAVGKTMP